MNAVTEGRVRELERILATGGNTAACYEHARQHWGLGDRQVRRLIVLARESIRQDWEIERPQMIAEMLSQLSSLQVEAREKGQLAIALGCINTAAKLCRLF
jgi:hypothetical protein